MTGSRDVFTPLGYQALVPTASTALTVPDGAQYCLITTKVQALRWTDDGTTPTLDVGQLQEVTDPPLWYSGNLHKVLIMNAVAGALVKVLYYK